jgi:hypothetical protein
LPYFEQCLSFPVRGNGNVHEDNEVIEFNSQSHENVYGRLEAVDSKRSIAENFGLPESTLRKKLKADTVPTFMGRCEVIFLKEEE